MRHVGPYFQFRAAYLHGFGVTIHAVRRGRHSGHMQCQQITDRGQSLMASCSGAVLG